MMKTIRRSVAWRTSRPSQQQLLIGPQRALSCCFSTETSSLNDEGFAARLRKEMMARPSTVIEDGLSPTRSQLLDLALADYLPASAKVKRGDNGLAIFLPPGHHLVYFPPKLTESQLLPDGTDPKHSPGPGFSRRLWAGGSIEFLYNITPSDTSKNDGTITGSCPTPQMSRRLRYSACRESITDVTVRGQPGTEKVYVDLLREYGRLRKSEIIHPDHEQNIAFSIREHRTLVFLRDEEVTENKAAEAQDQTPAKKAVRAPAPRKPDYSFELTPSRRLLFHFSALTHNAHLIHLDREYCRAREGHRDLLVHGPLSLVLMLTAAQAAGETVGPACPIWIQSVRYRNLAPLYVGESMRVCVRHIPKATTADPSPIDSWDVWIEGPDGGMAVRASITSTVAVQGGPREDGEV